MLALGYLARVTDVWLHLVGDNSAGNTASVVSGACKI
jgi:hypothetical protein